MPSIDELLPLGPGKDLPALRALDPEPLARYVADRGNPWWRRRHCVHALADRVPRACVPELIARVKDTGDTGEVRIALLDVLGDRPELLPWVRHEDRRDEKASGMPAALLRARGRLGDLSAVPELSAMAADPWTRNRQAGEAGLDALAARHGPAAVLALLDEERPQDRMVRVRMRARADEDVTGALADPDRAVAHLAASLADDADRLRSCAADPDSPVEAALWAAYALHRLTEDASAAREVWTRLGRPRVEVDGLDEETRAAIVHAYAPDCQRLSDPRWRIEALVTAPPAPVDVRDQLRRAAAALTGAGFEHGAPVSVGEHNHQGEGTYWVLPRGEYPVCVSTLGRFVTCHDPDPAVRRALEAAGFRWFDPAVDDVTVTGLCVYFFGSREPLGAGDLLFYWQD
ncbi:hypothetical protein ACWGRF_32295 [Streptomyces zhihengii]